MSRRPMIWIALCWIAQYDVITGVYEPCHSVSYLNGNGCARSAHRQPSRIYLTPAARDAINADAPDGAPPSRERKDSLDTIA